MLWLHFWTALRVFLIQSMMYLHTSISLDVGYTVKQTKKTAALFQLQVTIQAALTF